jgi:hypothetical protein
MQARRKGIPPVFGLLARGYAVIASIFLLYELGFFPGRGLAIFLISMTSIAMIFGIGHLLVAARRPIRKAPMDVPSTIILYAGGAVVMYFVTLLVDQGYLEGRAAGVILAGCSLALAFVATGGFLAEIASNVSSAWEPYAYPRPVKPR